MREWVGVGGGRERDASPYIDIQIQANRQTYMWRQTPTEI